MKKYKHKYKFVGFYVDPKDYKKFKKLWDKTGLSVSYFIRSKMKEELEK